MPEIFADLSDHQCDRVLVYALIPECVALRQLQRAEARDRFINHHDGGSHGGYYRAV